MAVISVSGKEAEVTDGQPIRDAAESLGVPFGCRQGFCGTCRVTILQGLENLNDLTEQERLMDIKKPQRLTCQCVITHGNVILKYQEKIS